MLSHTSSSITGRWIGVALLSVALAFGSVAAPAIAAPSDIDRILVDTNTARVAEGLPALKRNTAIDAVAQAWAQKMATDGFAHNPNFSSQIPAGWSLASENIAAGYSAATVVNAWLNSPGHRTNIMSTATDIGIGFYVAPNGTAYSVQNFAQYPPPIASGPGTASDLDRIFVDTNNARVAQGLPALKRNAAIDAVAQAWAQKMTTDGYAHNPNFSTQIPAGWSLASENIAAGYSAATVVNAWLNSPGHRTNIMSTATDIGIGFYVAANGTAYSVQNFAKYPPASAALTATPTPTISGSALLGRTLTATTGTWSPSPVTLAYQWASEGMKISGATTPTYVPVTADLGKRLTVTVTGTKAGYTTVARTSVVTAAVKGTLTATPTPTLSGTAKAGRVVTAVTGTWSPAPVTLFYQWARSGTVISGATSASYTLTAADVGARVTVTVTGTKLNYHPVARKSAASAVVVR
jgi:uncharacterized protein YkwD